MGSFERDAAKSSNDSNCCLPMTVETPVIVIEPASGAPNPGSGIGVATINYRTKNETLRCIESLRQSETPPEWLYVLDNSELDDGLEAALRTTAPFEHTRIAYFRSPKNLGFAEGSNVLIDRLFESADCQFVLFLNNDAVALPPLLGKLKQALIDRPGAGLSGPRVHKLDDPTQVDSLGIVIHSSLIPANRLSTLDPFLGPTGGCAMATRDCLTKLKEHADYYFDSRYFMYCEDTDLALRANRLGYEPAYIDDLLALHQGQASSNPGYNPVISYYGFRNSIWMTAKLIPRHLIYQHFFNFILANLLMTVYHLAQLNPFLVIKIYTHSIYGLPDFIRERQTLAKIFDAPPTKNRLRISRHFYRAGYIREATVRLLNRLKSTFIG